MYICMGGLRKLPPAAPKLVEDKVAYVYVYIYIYIYVYIYIYTYLCMHICISR